MERGAGKWGFQGGRTVEALGCVGNIRDAEVSREENDAYREVQPRAGAGVCEEDLDEHENRVQGVHGDVVPCWSGS